MAHKRDINTLRQNFVEIGVSAGQVVGSEDVLLLEDLIKIGNYFCGRRT